MHLLKIILTGIVLVLLIAYVGISVYIAKKMVRPYPTVIDVAPQSISERYEEIVLTTPDTVTLKGWLFPGTTDKLVVLVAGITFNRVNKDYHSVDLAKELLAKGYGVLMYDARGHGESTPTTITFGRKEGPDLLQVLSYAQTKGYKPQNIAIIADSLGAVSTLTVLDQLTSIGAIVVDSPAARVKPVATYILTVENGVPKIFLPGAFLMTKLIYGVDFNTLNPVDVVKRTNKSFLISWADHDPLMTKDQIDALLAASPQSTLVVFPGGKHIETYKKDPELYREKVLEYIDQSLNNKSFSKLR